MGMTITVIKNMLKKPATIKYPKKKSDISKNYRGRIVVDREKCIGCYLCQIHCPTGAIVVDPKDKKAYVDIGRCIFCSLCAEVCPVKCIHFTNEYEKVSKDKEKLKRQ